MSFLESVQHGLEKASREATRLAKIQHLHNISSDLTFKASQEAQHLVGKAMELHQQNALSQPDLQAICQQLVTYQQQVNEVQAEIQRLHDSKDSGDPDTPVSQPQAGYSVPQPVYAGGSEAPTVYLTTPGTPTSTSEQPTTSAEPPTQPGVSRKHRTPAEHATSVPVEPASTGTSGSYAQGVLPPIFSPFTHNPAAQGNASEPAASPPEKKHKTTGSQS